MRSTMRSKQDWATAAARPRWIPSRSLSPAVFLFTFAGVFTFLLFNAPSTASAQTSVLFSPGVGAFTSVLVDDLNIVVTGLILNASVFGDTLSSRLSAGIGFKSAAADLVHPGIPYDIDHWRFVVDLSIATGIPILIGQRTYAGAGWSWVWKRWWHRCCHDVGNRSLFDQGPTVFMGTEWRFLNFIFYAEVKWFRMKETILEAGFILQF